MQSEVSDSDSCVRAGDVTSNNIDASALPFSDGDDFISLTDASSAILNDDSVILSQPSRILDAPIQDFAEAAALSLSEDADARSAEVDSADPTVKNPNPDSFLASSLPEDSDVQCGIVAEPDPTGVEISEEDKSQFVDFAPVDPTAALSLSENDDPQFGDVTEADPTATVESSVPDDEGQFGDFTEADPAATVESSFPDDLPCGSIDRVLSVSEDDAQFGEAEPATAVPASEDDDAQFGDFAEADPATAVPASEDDDAQFGDFAEADPATAVPASEDDDAQFGDFSEADHAPSIPGNFEPTPCKKSFEDGAFEQVSSLTWDSEIERILAQWETHTDFPTIPVNENQELRLPPEARDIIQHGLGEHAPVAPAAKLLLEPPLKQPFIWESSAVYRAYSAEVATFIEGVKFQSSEPITWGGNPASTVAALSREGRRMSDTSEKASRDLPDLSLLLLRRAKQC